MEGNFGPFFLQTGKIEYEVCGGKEIVKGEKKVHGIFLLHLKCNRNIFAHRKKTPFLC